MRAIIILGLTSCNAWVRPAPSPAQARFPADQQLLAVKVESTCDPFDDGGNTKVGSGVIVSEWQVLTAFHVVDCGAAIANIHVTTKNGKRYRFSPEKEWQESDISRIQMATADRFRLGVSPPLIRLSSISKWEPIYIQAAWPDRVEIVGEPTGWGYYGEELSSGKFKYSAPTQPGNSGSAVYDIDGNMIAIHIGETAYGDKEGSRVVPVMIPH
jgi:S1-C subfamily serine protease